MQFNKAIYLSLLSSVIFLALPACKVVATPAASSNEQLPYGNEHSKTMRNVIDQLRARHYREMRFDDQLSEQFLQEYLDSLDPNRLFFLESNIKTFQKDARNFDDRFKKGDLRLAYEIYDIYQSHAKNQLNKALELTNREHTKFLFDTDEYVELDRESASWPKTIEERQALWDKRVRLAILNLKLAGKSVDEAKDTIAKRYKNQLKRLEQQTSTDIFEIVVNSLTVLYGPHTNYWSPRESENFNIQMSLSLEGIGAVLQTEDEMVKVVRLVHGGPAQKQGRLRASDRIIGVAQGKKGEMVDVVGWRLDEVVDLIRGKKGSTVVLEVLPRGSAPNSETETIEIVRDKVKLEDQAAKKAVIEVPNDEKNYRIGVINLPTFYSDFDAYNRRDPNYKSSTRDVAQLVQELKQEKIDGLVLDLRNNGGGSLREATRLTDLFIHRGPVVQIRSSDRRVDRSQRAESPPLYTGPLIVLINRLSASASEIFAGAIQDYGRGIVVGSQSFGKGTVQSVSPLLFGQVKMTESKFYRVSGDSTQHRGVIPDLFLPDLINKDDVGESSYDTALPWNKIAPAKHDRYYDFSPLLSYLQDAHEKRAASDADLIYIQDQAELIEKNRNRTRISLNEKIRNQEKEDREIDFMKIENKKRKALGEPLLASLREYRKFQDDEEERLKNEEDQRNNSVENPNDQPLEVADDALLQETSKIAADFIKAISDKRTAQTITYNKQG